MALVGIIIPVYNVEKYLSRCIDSLLTQSFRDFEILLVDDGSPDDCGSICDKYEKQDRRIHVIHQKNMGLSGARNTGLDWFEKNSKCEWIGFIDSDDWVNESYLETLLKAAITNKTEMSICEYISTTGDTPLLDGNPTTTIINDIGKFYLDHTVTATTAWGKLYKAELFSTIRYPLGKIHEDEFVTYKILFKCTRIIYIDKPLYYYYQNPDGIMLSKWNPRRMDAFEALEEQAMFFKQYYPALYKAQCLRYMKNLKRTLDVISGCDEYSDYVKQIHKKLKQLLICCRREIPWESIGSIAEIEFPIYMKMYWIFRSQQMKIKKKIKQKNSAQTGK